MNVWAFGVVFLLLCPYIKEKLPVFVVEKQKTKKKLDANYKTIADFFFKQKIIIFILNVTRR